MGAGCGIVSATLASRFDTVTVSDPNDGYADLARKILMEESSLPESRLRFLQEGAEKSSVETGSVDLVTACECIHWTDVDASIKEFGRELKRGGTLAVTHYNKPRFVNNDRAQRAWQALWDYHHAERSVDDSFTRAFRVVGSGLDSVGFPEEEWEGVERIYINAAGSVRTFVLDERVGESRVKEGEERVWEEDDEDWCDLQGIDYFKGYFVSWAPFIPEEEIPELWRELEDVLDGEKAKISTALVIVLATKK